jgi:hypothetical protein
VLTPAELQRWAGLHHFAANNSTCDDAELYGDTLQIWLPDVLAIVTEVTR